MSALLEGKKNQRRALEFSRHLARRREMEVIGLRNEGAMKGRARKKRQLGSVATRNVTTDWTTEAEDS